MAQSLGQYRLGVGTMWNARTFATVRAKLWGFTSPLFNLLLNHLVALTAGLFELSLVENLNLAPTIVDKTCLLKDASGDSDIPCDPIRCAKGIQCGVSPAHLGGKILHFFDKPADILPWMIHLQNTVLVAP